MVLIVPDRLVNRRARSRKEIAPNRLARAMIERTVEIPPSTPPTTKFVWGRDSLRDAYSPTIAHGFILKSFVPPVRKNRVCKNLFHNRFRPAVDWTQHHIAISPPDRLWQVIELRV